VDVFDTETGKNLAELNIKNAMEEIEMPVDNFTAEKKFSQLRSAASMVDNIAISGNMVFRMQHDLRTKPGNIIIKDKGEVTKRNLEFTCVATTPDGEVAVGTNSGEIKLFSSPEEKWTQAKTNITQLAQRITGLDISFDGEWVLATTSEYLALIHVGFLDPKSGKHTTAFKTRMPAEERKSVLILKLSDATKVQLGLAEIQFKPAKFDSSTSIGVSGVVEEYVLTSTAQYIISWNFRKLTLDYKKLQTENRVETTVVPDIKRMEQVVQATQFEWNTGRDSVVVAATEEMLSRLALGQ